MKEPWSTLHLSQLHECITDTRQVDVSCSHLDPMLTMGDPVGDDHVGPDGPYIADVCQRLETSFNGRTYCDYVYETSNLSEIGGQRAPGIARPR